MPNEIEFKNEDALIDKTDIREIFTAAKDYIGFLKTEADSKEYDKNESSINLPFDADMIEKTLRFSSDKKFKNLKHVILIGIGGSNLGTMAVYKALRGEQDLLDKQTPKMIFADTVSSSLISKILALINDSSLSASDFAIIVSSKSGKTLETATNYKIIQEAFNGRFKGEAKDRIMFITNGDSKLYTEAKEGGSIIIETEKNIGGRYSVLSPVSLFPLALAGIDVKSLILGAKEIRDACLANDSDKNPAFVRAAVIYSHYKKGIKILNSFFFNPEMEWLGKWHRQLMGESLGKEKSLKGEKVEAGVTPIVSIGSTDLHSIVQLYFGGPKDKLTFFVYALEESDESTKQAKKVMDAIYNGTKEAYRKKSLPFMEMVLPRLSEEFIGAYLQMEMISTMILANLMNVNAFDQPEVENYKREIKIK